MIKYEVTLTILLQIYGFSIYKLGRKQVILNAQQIAINNETNIIK
jgi:hypothetical protein